MISASKRTLLVYAFAFSMLEDILSDCGVGERGLPVSLDEAKRELMVGLSSDFGNRFEETPLQGSAPQYSAAADTEESRQFYAEAEALVDRYLWSLSNPGRVL